MMSRLRSAAAVGCMAVGFVLAGCGGTREQAEGASRFLPREKRLEISQVFRWYAKDFQKPGGVPRVLATYSPARYRDFLATGDYAIEYLDYNRGLNDQEGRGARYGGLALLRDAIRDRFR